MRRVLALMLVLGGTGAAAQTVGTVQDLGPALVLDRTARFEIAAPQGPLAVVVGWPDQPPPPEGYGIIYALDAGWSFATLREALVLQGSAQAAGPVRPTVVVGIGWPGPGLIDLARRGPDLIDPPGAAATLALLTDTILPRIEAVLPVDPRHRMVLGHSYGGAFALRAGFARPDLFSHVAAGSPSLWTDPGAYAPPSGPRPAVLLTIGALERPAAAKAAGIAPERIERLAARDMAGRAERLAQDLGTGLQEIPGQGHGGSVPGFLAAAVSFLWR
ncbi:alpha/beta hydrolase [Rhodobacter capsulatus]|uniref:Alpha/beta hydrolase n=1 Tax=Rhodobacter capsulatus TaxID=1061 RepID=A0A4U1K2Y1_RHOCA|nr:alpha/beta hydrolase-fold protein [Rhodobacter capsulatus]TKD26236.1 alpha/beta hydrolase [Rhodobacter capsulatus]